MVNVVRLPRAQQLRAKAQRAAASPGGLSAGFTGALRSLGRGRFGTFAQQRSQKGAHQVRSCRRGLRSGTKGRESGKKRLSA